MKQNRTRELIANHSPTAKKYLTAPVRGQRLAPKEWLQIPPPLASFLINMRLIEVSLPSIYSSVNLNYPYIIIANSKVIASRLHE
jgi:hypothetical protein